MTNNLTKAWDSYLVSERHAPGIYWRAKQAYIVVQYARFFCITKHSSALYIGMAKVLPIIVVLGYDGQNSSFSSPPPPRSDSLYYVYVYVYILGNDVAIMAYVSNLMNHAHNFATLSGVDNVSRSSRGSEKRGGGGILRSNTGKKKDKEAFNHSMMGGIVKVSLTPSSIDNHCMYVHTYKNVYSV